MAELTNTENHGSSSSGSKPRSSKMPVHVDMTPMVDLGFLLIAFFMLTMIIENPRKIDLDKRITADSTPVADCRVLNVLIDSMNRIYTYEGTDLKTLKQTSFDANSGIRHRIFVKAKSVKQGCGLDKNGQAHEMVCLIKLLPKTRYKEMVDIMDEMAITGTRVYSMQEPIAEEINEIDKINPAQYP